MNIFKKNYKYGFTLVELLVVITVIAILASVSFKAASVMSEKAAVARTSKRLAVISAYLAEYYSEFGQYPAADRVVYTNWNEGAKPPDWDAKVAEKRASGDPDFAKDDDDALIYYLMHFMEGQKWDEFEEEAGVHRHTVGGSSFISGDVAYSNVVYVLRDGWSDSFEYKCEEPYTSYKLYSRGNKRGIHETEDDIHAGQKY